MGYSWDEYYRNAYEAEKKRSRRLAGEVADAEAKREELQVKYSAICANPLYRASRLLSLPKRGCKKIAREAKKLWEGGNTAGAPEELLAAYRERTAFQKGAYAQWIAEEEPALWRRCREALKKGKCRQGIKKTCLVLPYESLAGVTDLTEAIQKGGDIQRMREQALREKGEEVPPDILLFAENPEDLDGEAVSYIENRFAAFPETKLFYGAQDHRVRKPGGQAQDANAGQVRFFPWFKPCFSPDTLLGFFYFGSYFAVDRAWAERTGLSGYAEARQNLYDFVLRLLKPCFEGGQPVLSGKDDGVPNPGGAEEREIPDTGSAEGRDIPNAGSAEGSAIPSGGSGAEEAGHAEGIVCTDLILYHDSAGAFSEMPADREYFLHVGEMRAERNPEFWGFEEEYTKLKQDFINSICYETITFQTPYPEVWSVVPKPEEIGTKGHPLVSVVIPSRDHPALLEKCIGSFLERTALPDLEKKVEFIVVDNGSGEKNRQVIEDFLESAGVQCHYLYRSMPFNFSAMCNLGEKKAQGEYVLLLNDDMEVIEENWLGILLGQARLPGVGAVGAKLWYPEGEKIQHAGITNMRVGPSHKLVTFPDDRTYYYGYNTLPHDMIAVTAACLLVRRSLYEEAGGFDEGMAVAYNDVDFCFKLLEKGCRNVIRNDAVLLHHESASRGLDEESAEKWQRLLQEKTALYNKHPLFYYYDPYYSEQLVYNAPEYRIGYQYPYERTLLTAEPERKEGKKLLRRALSSAVMLTLERAGEQHKIRLEEPDILMAEGWCYLLDQDNCLFERFLILEAEEDFYYEVPVKDRLRPDVEAILPAQTNIELSGFTCRILKQHLISGKYTVGMLCRNLCGGRLSYNSSGKVVII